MLGNRCKELARVGKEIKIIVISGYYGFNNSGDEAVLQSILLALEEEGKRQGLQVQPIVLSNSPERTAAAYGVRTAHRMKLGEIGEALRQSDGMISGGGSLLQDVTGLFSIPYYLGILIWAQRLKKPTFIYSQGIGPVRRKLFYPFVRGVFSRCAYVSVRDKESADLLERMGLKKPDIHVVPDPVMGMPLRGAVEGEPVQQEMRGEGRIPIVGVSVRFWNPDRSELLAIAKALSEIRRHRKVELRFLPFHVPGDVEASRFVMNSLEATALDSGITIMEANHPQDMLAHTGECSLLIGMRLHSLIYAASQLVPMIGISYDPKIDQFLDRIGMKPGGRTDALDPNSLADKAIRLLNGQAEWRQSVEPAVAALRAQAHEPAKYIVTALLKGHSTNY
jgi:polysaccharide pyruvyl transferase CsaB